jgi:hypothetical protein
MSCNVRTYHALESLTKRKTMRTRELSLISAHARSFYFMISLQAGSSSPLVHLPLDTDISRDFYLMRILFFFFFWKSR